MKSQWECLLQNLGEWQGSFTRFSPDGELREDTPTIVSLEGRNNNQTVHQVVRRLVPGAEDLVLEYSSLNRSILFFEAGEFSQGSMQFGPFSEFGAEFGFIQGDRRLRLVQLFDRESNLSQITLIREKLAETSSPERPALTLDSLLGEWQGEAVTLYPDWRNPDRYPTYLKLWREGDRLHQQLSFGDAASQRTIQSSAAIEGSVLKFDQGTQVIQVLLLPDGASSTCPVSIQARQPILLEAGWLVQPDRRLRMIRSYDSKGEWVSLTLVTERKVGG